jgi:fumarylacetoacetate (FAA) hydrolase family protein
VVAIRENGVFDISDEFPTASQLAASDPAEALRATKGVRIGALQDILNNTPPDTRDPTKPWLLAPIDLQVIKAAGVTFAISMLERGDRGAGARQSGFGAGHPGRGDADRRHRPCRN